MAGLNWVRELFRGTPSVRVRCRPRAAARLRVNALEDRLLPATLLVYSAADSGPGTLRAAITKADSMSGPVTIDFDIALGGGIQTINLTSALPAISTSVFINGTNEPGYAGSPLIVLNGAGAGANASGLILDSQGSAVEGLFIKGFAQDGVLLRNGASGNTIGGSAFGDGNVISGNGNDGIEIVNSGTKNNVVQGNFIGTNLAGTAALANKFDGMVIRAGASGNTIGGTFFEDANLISGNGNDGIEILNSGTTNNLVQGNFIGINRNGTAAIANRFDGVNIRAGAARNTIGGAALLARNVISGNGNDGIEILNSGTTNNLVRGNFIGTNAVGSAPLANGANGVLIRTGASGNTIGGTTAGTGNVISGNANDGIEIVGAGTTNNLVEGNTVGAQWTGSRLGNAANGIAVSDDAGHNTIGGTARGAGNLIAFNAGDGVLIGDTSPGIPVGTGNAIEGNSIFGNGRLGIFLGYDNTSKAPVVRTNFRRGPTAVNDSFENYPVLNPPVVTGNGTSLTGTLSSPSSPKTTFRIEFFASSSADGSGYGPGEMFVGAVTVTTDANGNAPFSLTLPTLFSGQVISATATDALGNTSEFARSVIVP